MAEVSQEGTFIEVNGIRLWHRITGEGEPVVQIHGEGPWGITYVNPGDGPWKQ